MDKRQLEAILKFEVEKNSANLSKEKMEELRKGLEKINDAAEKSRKKLMAMREAAEKFQNIGTQLGAVGAAITGAFALAAKTYVDKAGESEETSRKWLATTKELEKAQETFGRAAAQALQPYMDELAKVMNMAANFAAKNPKATSAILGAGVSATALGALTVAATQGIRMYADIKLIGVAATQNIAADKMLKAAGIQAGAAGVAGAGKAGVAGAKGLFGGGLVDGALAVATNPLTIAALVTLLAGQIANSWMRNNTEYGKNMNPNVVAGGLTAGGQALTMAAGGAGYMLAGITGKDSTQTVKDFMMAAGKFLGVVQDTADGVSNAADQMGPSVSQIQAYLQYRQQETQATQQYSQQRAAIIQQYEQDIVSITQQYESQRASIIANYEQQSARATEDYQRQTTQAQRDFAASEAQAEAAYYAQRQQLAQSFGVEMARMEQDHQREMRKLARDHQDRLSDLIDSRDALGIERENRDYERQRQDSEEQYQIEAARRQEDFARQLAEMEANYRQQKAQRAADFKKQMADRAAEFALQQKRAKEDFQQQLADLAKNYEDQKQQRYQQFQQQLNDLSDQFTREQNARKAAFAQQMIDLEGAQAQERNLRNQMSQAMYDDLQGWINKVKAQINGEGPGDANQQKYMASGGYASYGLYHLGEAGREFVLNNRTTRAAESVARGQLSQEKLMRMLAGGGGGQIINYHDHRQFNRRLTAEDRLDLRRDTRKMLGDILGA